MNEEGNVLESSSVKRVTDSSDSESVLEADPVVDDTSEEAEDSESAVHDGVGGRDGVGLSSSSCSKTTEGVPHAWGGEGDGRGDQDLEGHRPEDCRVEGRGSRQFLSCGIGSKANVQDRR